MHLMVPMCGCIPVLKNISKLMVLKLWLDAQSFGRQFAKRFLWQYLGLGDYDNMLGNISIQLYLFWQSTSTSIQHYVLLILWDCSFIIHRELSKSYSTEWRTKLNYLQRLVGPLLQPQFAHGCSRAYILGILYQMSMLSFPHRSLPIFGVLCNYMQAFSTCSRCW
mgnify:CR=1 FL=1